jgi:hypothetical protein
MKRRVGRKKLNLHKLKRSLIFGLVLALFISVGLKNKYVPDTFS